MSPGHSDWCASGLSPRVRGNRRPAVPDALAPGSIPACAGEPGWSCRRWCRGRVYPRVCGGTPGAVGHQSPRMGLSPRVRGNRRPRFCSASTGRSIPACAGEPAMAVIRSSWARVYPRVCGGTARALRRVASYWGLSPRVRGNPGQERYVRKPSGSIPACAGEPNPTSSRIIKRRVYPRVCGGTQRRRGNAGCRQGLSPRVRGNRCAGRDGEPPSGSIPACAGEPGAAGPQGLFDRVYPRVCGGTVRSFVKTTLRWGLSPRVRGNRHDHGIGLAELGSIPACAGEPLRAASAALPPRVYPRVCGGTAASTSV